MFLFVDDPELDTLHSGVPGECWQHEFSEHCWSEEVGLDACLAGQGLDACLAGQEIQVVAEQVALIEKIGYLNCSLYIDGVEDILAPGDESDDLPQLSPSKSSQEFVRLVPSVLEDDLIAQGGGIEHTLPLHPGNDLCCVDITWRATELYLWCIVGTILHWEKLIDP